MQTLPVAQQEHRAILTMKNKTPTSPLTVVKRKPTFREVLDGLKPELAREFEQDLYNICVAYYAQGDWKRLITRAKSRFTIGTRKIVMDYLNVLDGEMIDLISHDFISRGF